MQLPTIFYSESNLELAFHRLVRSSNKSYKALTRHLVPSYFVSLSESLDDLADSLRIGTYEPSPPIIVFQPKKSGVLRPISVLTLQDQIVYQSIVNVVAAFMASVQKPLALKVSFGHLLTDARSPFFFQSWKKCYREYSLRVEDLYNKGYTSVADFDLVACYELIDHSLLCARLSDRVPYPDLIEVLQRCLRVWTTNLSGGHLRHGLPQGPEASAFLAECMLFQFDELSFRNVKYLRYVDDIRLMAKGEIPLRRALLRLDLKSKDLGLVPQAQKITVHVGASLDEILKSVPSGLAGGVKGASKAPQGDLLEVWRTTLKRKDHKLMVVDDTKFKFSLLRLNPRREVLRRIRPLLVSRPDLSWFISRYLMKFPGDREAADIILESLKQDPTYDSAAADYINAMDVCEPATANTKYRRVIQTAMRRSQEQSVTLRIAAKSFRCRRMGPTDALNLVKTEAVPLARSTLIDRVFARDGAPHKVALCLDFLRTEMRSSHEDLARLAGYVFVKHHLAEGSHWRLPRNTNRAVKLMTVGLGLRSHAPARRRVLPKFLEEVGVKVRFPWSKALKGDFPDVEHRTARLRELLVGDPTARILMLDTLNEALVQRFSQDHALLGPAYTSAAGRKQQPDFGSWIRNGNFVKQLPVASKWFQEVHDARVRADLAHAKQKGGQPTREITFDEADELVSGLNDAWLEMIQQWSVS